MLLATLLDSHNKGHAFTEDTMSKAKQWLKEEHTIVTEQQKTDTTEDQGQDLKLRKLEEKEEPGPSAVLEQMYANIWVVPCLLKRVMNSISLSSWISTSMRH